MRSFFKKVSLFQAFLRGGGKATPGNMMGVGGRTGNGGSSNGKRIAKGAVIGGLWGLGLGAVVEMARKEVWEWTWKGPEKDV